MSDIEEVNTKPKTNIAELFREAQARKTYLKICAPMVRYSKLEFRHLVRRYDTDLTFTPMTMADSFCQSYKARLSEFSTSTTDTPVIAQFAAKNVMEYLSAAEMVYPYVDGIDLNCGCPQSWAIESGYGCALLKDPELIKDLTSNVRRNLSSNFSVSVKIRVQNPLSQTIELCRQLEHCGVTFLTVHGRTPYQKIRDPSNAAALAEIKQSISIPLVANGDVKTLDGANRLYAQTGCDGVMSARGILSNPALYAGHDQTPLECVQDWVDLCDAVGDAITFQCFHHHLTFMMDKMMRRKVRVEFNNFTTKTQVMEFLAEHFSVVARPLGVASPQPGTPIVAEFDETAFKERMSANKQAEAELRRQQRRQIYSSDDSKGKYFTEVADAAGDSDEEDDGIDCSDLFAAE